MNGARFNSGCRMSNTTDQSELELGDLVVLEEDVGWDTTRQERRKKSIVALFVKWHGPLQQAGKFIINGNVELRWVGKNISHAWHVDD